MSRSTIIRTDVFSALSGLEHEGVPIPIFDEVVNNVVPIPAVGGASEVYVVLQDQQEFYNAVQTVCNPRFNLNLTIRVVTVWGLVGSKKLCEEIGEKILNLLRNERGDSEIEGYQRVELTLSRTLTEQTQTNLAFSRIINLNFIKNG